MAAQEGGPVSQGAASCVVVTSAEVADVLGQDVETLYQAANVGRGTHPDASCSQVRTG